MRVRTRYVVMALLGTAGLLLKAHYQGPWQQAVHNWGGNLVASFAVYGITALLPLASRFGRLSVAALALAVVELFEFAGGFGVMTNVYDPVDFAANAVGVALALAADVAAGRMGPRWTRPRRTRF